MKSKILFLILSILLLTGCQSNKEKVKDYLRNHDYEGRIQCFQKENKNIISRYCLEECKIYMADKSIDDYFTVDLKNQKIEYVFDYMTYKYDITSDEKICLFQGEEIDNNSSYCINAWKGFEKHYKLLNKELKNARVKINNICK